MSKKFNICLIEPVFHNAFNTPSSNLENVLFKVSNNFYNIKCTSDDLDIARNSKYKEYIITHKESSNSFLRILRYISLQIKMSFRLINLRKKIDICIFFNESSFILPMIISKLLGKKVLWQLPSSLKKTLYYNDNSFSFFLNLMQNLSYNLVDNIILYSPNLIHEWELEKYKNKVLIAHEHIIDPAEFKIMKDYDKRDCLIGYVGRLSKEKGIFNFVKSIKIMLEKEKNVKYLIIGSGELENSIKNYLNENKLNRNVKMINWVPHNELPSYFNELKLLVIPSYTEGLPNVMLESMACGTPVLATQVGSIPDIIADQETGFILKENSVECISNNIEKVLSFSKLNKVSENTCKFVKSEFNENITSKKWLNIFQGELNDE